MKEQKLAKARSKLRENIIGYIILTILIGGLILYSYRPNERIPLYDIMKELKVGMTRTDVLKVIDKHYKPFIHKSLNQTSDETISLSVYYFNFFISFSCHLVIDFSQDKLISAIIRGENGPNDIFKDAPRDIK